MTEQEVNDLVGFYKALNMEMQKLGALLSNEKEASKLDGLNRDLAITQAQAMQTLLSVLTVRIGLNINAVKAQKNAEEVEQPKEEPTDEQKDPAQERSEPEQ